MSKKVEITDGPEKPALQWAVAYPEREQVDFHTTDDAFEARISRIEERGDGFDFELQGTVASGSHKGRELRGRYGVETRSGLFVIAEG